MSCSLEKERFLTDCQCLSQNTECGNECGCFGKNCLNSAIQQKAILKLGEDIVEQDSWGMDCYTRRNVLDGKLHISLLITLLCLTLVKSLVQYRQVLHPFTFCHESPNRQSIHQECL